MSKAVIDTEPRWVSFSPDGRYAVLEIRPGELFAAFFVEETEGDTVRGRYAGYAWIDGDGLYLRKTWIEWEWIEYGFCKLRLWAPEEKPVQPGVFERTVARFWFDRELYEKKKQELHGGQEPED